MQFAIVGAIGLSLSGLADITIQSAVSIYIG